MDDYISKLKGDLAEQFRGKANIESLLEVLGSELQQVYAFFEQLRDERGLYNAVGKQLDGVGDIAVMSRREAAQLAGLTTSMETTDDELYRQYLIYKILKNTCDCTYDSLISAIKMFWRGESVKYREDPNYPATIILTIKGFSDTGNLRGLLQVPIIKAAGVGALMETETAISGTLYIGVIHQQEIESKWEGEDYELGILLTDEQGNVLIDEDGNFLIDALVVEGG